MLRAKLSADSIPNADQPTETLNSSNQPVTITYVNLFDCNKLITKTSKGISTSNHTSNYNFPLKAQILKLIPFNPHPQHLQLELSSLDSPPPYPPQSFSSPQPEERLPPSLSFSPIRLSH